MGADLAVSRSSNWNQPHPVIQSFGEAIVSRKSRLTLDLVVEASFKRRTVVLSLVFGFYFRGSEFDSLECLLSLGIPLAKTEAIEVLIPANVKERLGGGWGMVRVTCNYRFSRILS